jgi:hypothetical protein|tara:strand:+ start:407 stop:610 length:204 start_codon:yes stop_codon:yes gene_type:complete
LYVEQIIIDLKKINPVKEIQGIYGMYDILIKIQSDDCTIDEIIYNSIRKIKNITSTVTLNLTDSKEN